MKSIFTICLVLICSFVFAQENVTSVAEGSRAILFSFRGLDFLNANEYNGGIGGKYFIAPDLAVRVGLVLDSFTETTPANADSTEKGSDGEYSAFSFGINAAVEWHLTAKRVSPYVGGGISYTSSSIEQYPDVTWPQSFTGLVWRTKTTTDGIGGFSIFGIAGVEIFIIKEISLSAEYHIAYKSMADGDVKQSITVLQGDVASVPDLPTLKGNETSSFGFESAGFLTLAVYF